MFESDLSSSGIVDFSEPVVFSLPSHLVSDVNPTIPPVNIAPLTAIFLTFFTFCLSLSVFSDSSSTLFLPSISSPFAAFRSSDDSSIFLLFVGNSIILSFWLWFSPSNSSTFSGVISSIKSADSISDSFIFKSSSRCSCNSFNVFLLSSISLTILG